MRWQVLPISVVQIEKELDRSVAGSLSLGNPASRQHSNTSLHLAQSARCLWQVCKNGEKMGAKQENLTIHKCKRSAFISTDLSERHMAWI